jgi:dihydroorotate dehydrogenase
MFGAMFDLARPFLFALDPESAHELTLKSLEMGVHPRCSSADDAALAVSLWGLAFPNPLAIAAGFDKDARVPDAILGMGCGFAEVGTTTPLPQPGNPAPRVFRLVPDRGVINRLGFNNEGHAAAYARLAARTHRGIVGVNIGANKESADRAADYVAGIERFYDVASYFTVNISSPNTPGLRDLQAPEALEGLLSRVIAARAKLIAAGKPTRPVIVKIAPDIAEEDVAPIANVLLGLGVDGIAVSNTTLARPPLQSPEARESGGLSGRPLFHRSTVMLARIYEATGGRVPLVGIGGIDSSAAALAKIEAGASLLQLYTGLIFEGPGLIGRIKSALVEAVKARGAASITALTGTKAKDWAAKSLG